MSISLIFSINTHTLLLHLYISLIEVSTSKMSLQISNLSIDNVDLL